MKKINLNSFICLFFVCSLLGMEDQRAIILEKKWVPIKRQLSNNPDYASWFIEKSLQDDQPSIVKNIEALGRGVQKRCNEYSCERKKNPSLPHIELVIGCNWQDMPTEIRYHILTYLLPMEITSSDQLVAVLKGIAHVALLNNESFSFVNSDYFIREAQATFNTISYAEIFEQAGKALRLKIDLPRIDEKKEIEKGPLNPSITNVLLNIFTNRREFFVPKMDGNLKVLASFRRMHDIIVRMRRILEKLQWEGYPDLVDQMARLTESWLDEDFNPCITFDPGRNRVRENLLGMVEIGREPDLAIRLLRLGIKPEYFANDGGIQYFERADTCTRDKYIQLFSLLIEKGFNPNNFLTDNWAKLHDLPLLYFAMEIFKSPTLVELLLQKGANPRRHYTVPLFGGAEVHSSTNVWIEAEELAKNGNPEYLALFRNYEKN